MSYTPKPRKETKQSKIDEVKESSRRIDIIAFSISLIVILIILAIYKIQPNPIDSQLVNEVKAEDDKKEVVMEAIKPPTKFTVTIYNHDGSVRGEYKDVTYWKYYQPTYKVSSNNIVELPEYGVQFLGEFTISPQKD